MFSADLQSQLRRTLGEIEQAGLYKRERFINSSQAALIRLEDGREVLFGGRPVEAGAVDVGLEGDPIGDGPPHQRCVVVEVLARRF